MSARSAPPDPSAGGDEGVARLQSALRSAQFDTVRISQAVRAEGRSLTPSPAQVPVVLQRLPDRGPLSTLIRLFVAGVPVPAKEAADALAPLDVETAAAMHLLTVDHGDVTPCVHIVPVGPLVLTFDLTPDPSRLAQDVVMGLSDTSWALVNLTPRRPVMQALDLGTGCGIQALLLSSHATRVTATDANPRALAFARFNAALNGVTNIDFVEGDLFEPVGPKRFDLVVANPPFVISPRGDYLYRDSGWARDELSRHVVRGAAGVLEDGAIACALVSWVHDPERDWWEPLEQWVEGLGCDGWLLHFNSDSVEEHVLNWNQHLQVDPPRYAEAAQRWLDYFAAESITMIGHGAVVLRRRAGSTQVRAYSLGTPPLGPAEDQIGRLVATRDYIEGLGGPAALLNERFALNVRHRLEQVARLRDGRLHVEHARLHLDGALPVLAEVDPFIVHVLTRLEGGLPLDQAIDEAAGALGMDVDRRALRACLLGVIERYLELGFLHPRNAPEV